MTKEGCDTSEERKKNSEIRKSYIAKKRCIKCEFFNSGTNTCEKQIDTKKYSKTCTEFRANKKLLNY